MPVAGTPTIDVFGINPLTVLIFAPALGGLLVLGLPNSKVLARWASLIIALGVGLLATIVFSAMTAHWVAINSSPTARGSRPSTPVGLWASTASAPPWCC